ncbi:MAG TPA: hypothetical protein VGM73_05200 [Candidatus Didemnitutus sp.]|jgi:hypothetical protein
MSTLPKIREANFHTDFPMQTHKQLPSICAFLLAAVNVLAQINTGSDGHDGALNPTSDLTIDMADHPDGIYQYSSVNIPAGVTVTFVPNVTNTPVTWLIQGSVEIDGTIVVSGGTASHIQGAAGGPGGYPGGNGVAGSSPATSGQGPGGGAPESSGIYNYGNTYLIPLIGGSGGGGSNHTYGYGDNLGGGGGGGAILVASSATIAINGAVQADAGNIGFYSGHGSGGAIRLVAAKVIGIGQISANANGGSEGGSEGRVRLDTYDYEFGGTIYGQFSRGFQPIIVPASGQGAQLSIANVAGVSVASSLTGALATPDVVVPGQQANPVSIVVSCSNMPLNTPISVNVTPMNGAAVSVTGYNSSGTQASSTATVSLNLPRGGGLIYAQATIGLLVTSAGPATRNGIKGGSYARTGLTTNGERFTKMEITAALGGKQQVAYLTDSGKRYAVATR